MYIYVYTYFTYTHSTHISVISDSYFSFRTMVFVEEIFLGIILALLMDGLQFLPPPSWRNSWSKRLFSPRFSPGKWPQLGFCRRWCRLGPVGVFGLGLIDESDSCLLMDGFFRNPGRDVYKNPCKSVRFQLPTSTSTGEFARTGVSGCHPSAWLDLEVSDEWFHQNQTYEFQKMEIVDFERVSNIKDVCLLNCFAKHD